MINTVFAHAKVNLHLAVGPLQESGFHAIQSIFARVALADELEVLVEPGPFSITVTGLEQYCEPATDTISRSAMMWYEHTDCERSLHVRVNKRIPVQSGLGGGSSDAAAMLRLLNGIAPLSEEALWHIGKSIGSDVPFFLSGAQAALVQGRGEFVQPLAARSLPILLVMPRFVSTSTKAAYAQLDQMRGESVPVFRDNEEVVTIYNKSCATWCNMLYNDFYMTVAGVHFYEELRRLSEDLHGYATITGSGSCWFFTSEDLACVERMKERVTAAFDSEALVWQTTLLS